MVELAEIFRIHGPAYLAKYQGPMPPSHLKAINAILECRTDALGGQLYHCEKCDREHYSYHSCKNRHCPKCSNDTNNEWLSNQRVMLLPVTHFMVTFTLPETLKRLARSNQKLIYNILFRASAAALQKLAQDRKYVGGKIGMAGVLQTWTRDLHYHPHIHYIVPGGGISDDGAQWRSASDNFLLPVKALSVIFRAKFRDELKQSDLFEQVPPDTWEKDWIVHCQPVGNGEHALEYVAPYISRVALSNNRILKLQDGKVTFRYKDSDSGEQRTLTLCAEEFIRRFLQHVLPDRFVKVRYYGLLATRNRPLLKKAQQLLGVVQLSAPLAEDGENTPQTIANAKSRLEKTIPCPKCGTPMICMREIPPKARYPPGAANPQQLVIAV